MEIFVISFLVFVLAALGLAIGAVRRRPVVAGCAAAAEGDPELGCAVCGRPGTQADRS